MSKPVRILTTYYMHKPGGFCKRLQMMIEACLDRGWQVHYLAVEPFPYRHPNLVPHLLPAPMKRRKGLVFWMYFFAAAPVALLWLGIRLRLDLIVAVSPVYACLSLPLARLRKVPIFTLLLSKPVFNTGTREAYASLKTVERWMEKHGLEASRALVANSSGNREAWVDQYGPDLECIEVIPNNVHVPAFDKISRRKLVRAEFSIPDDEFLIATASILEPHKNIEYLLTAFAALPGHRARLFILGDGWQLAALKASAHRMGVAERVVFTGWRTDALELIQGMDLFVLPSFREGMSESLLEAMTCRLPCLVSAVPENMEVVTHPGQHFDPERPEDLAEKINRLMEDPARYGELLEATRKDGERYIFDWGKKMTEAALPLIQRQAMEG